MNRRVLMAFAAPLLAASFLVGAPLVPTARADDDVEIVSLDQLGPGMEVKIVKFDGGVVEGRVEGVGQQLVQVRTSFGVISVRRDNIDRVERFKSLDSLYEERAKKCATVADWIELADWAESKGSGEYMREALDEALKIEPDNAEIRERLGQKKLDDEWVSEEEWYEANGYEFFRGKWRTNEEIQTILDQEQNRDASEVAKGREALQREYAGRPWSQVAPIETPNYWVLCNSTEEVAQRYAAILEALYETYDKLFQEKYFPRQGTGRKSRVYIHANYDQFLQLTGMQRGVGGFFRPAPPLRDVTAYHGSFGTSGSTPEVLAHEGTHQFQALIFKNMNAVPAWTIEGMAVYFGDGTKIYKKGGRWEVDINVIPRERLIGLQNAIENGSYANLETLMTIPQPSFGGFYYMHGWGIFYWCWRDLGKFETGINIMNDWMLYCRDSQQQDLGKHAQKFRTILQTFTGQGVSQWESEYKQFILDLEVPTVVKHSSNEWESEKLKCSGKRVGGWRKIDERKLSESMPVAFGITDKSARRIGTMVTANWQKAELDVEAVKTTMLNQWFESIEYLDGGEPKKTKTYGFDTVVAKFKGRQTEARTQGVGADDTGGESPEYLFHVVLYRTPDRFYCNIQRASSEDMDVFVKDGEKFEKYLDGFEINFTGG